MRQAQYSFGLAAQFALYSIGKCPATLLVRSTTSLQLHGSFYSKKGVDSGGGSHRGAETRPGLGRVVSVRGWGLSTQKLRACRAVAAVIGELTAGH